MLSLRRRLVTAVMVLLAVVVTAALAFHRSVPNVAGFGSALDTAAPLLLLAVPVLVLGAVVARTKLAVAAVLAPLLVWGLMFGGAWLPKGDPAATQLRVASQNVNAANPDPAATAGAVADTEADLVALVEVAEGLREPTADTMAARYAHHVRVSTVELWSRYPIVDYAPVDTALGWERALRAVVETPQGRLTVYAVHLGSARPGVTATRDRSLRALADAVAADPADRLVVLGDLNTAVTDRVMAPLRDLVRDAQADAGRGPGATWPASLPVIRPDQIFYRGLTATMSTVVRTPATDHRAVLAGFSFS
ncbi:endonuclease/exonuclease/phosphatase family protein [Asanoa sp. WMMD1127]|uniref:endonuclease/exonuclease/phosphatase family protein n=1 Tax=Asanoa sp. WMMD1127 TaxID=3016107 RepID=UPI002415FF07|nr:endonuclease/exonuclease/phosphatase family protein [Asanoa sp. WMMD1127]MDG4825943.1 endonuclease/exonuclease/phosphatase family protein [Asanoa sp. WMMD1127]